MKLSDDTSRVSAKCVVYRIAPGINIGSQDADCAEKEKEKEREAVGYIERQTVTA